MASFFEKLKKGMGIEIEKSASSADVPKEHKEEEKSASSTDVPKNHKEVPKSPKPKKVQKDSTLKSEVEPAERAKKLKIKAVPLEAKTEKAEPKKAEAKKAEEPELKGEVPQKAPEKIEAPKQNPEIQQVDYGASKFATGQAKKEWPEPEGELAIDVYQTEKDLVIQTAIAGVQPENLDVSMERDILIVRGVRQKPFEENGDYFTRECFWGPFSREVILPVEVDPNQAEAIMKEGILTIRIPKILREKKRTIRVKD